MTETISPRVARAQRIAAIVLAGLGGVLIGVVSGFFSPLQMISLPLVVGALPPLIVRSSRFAGTRLAGVAATVGWFAVVFAMSLGEAAGGVVLPGNGRTTVFLLCGTAASMTALSWGTGLFRWNTTAGGSASTSLPRSGSPDSEASR
jgi:hypothetical protein